MHQHVDAKNNSYGMLLKLCVLTIAGIVSNPLNLTANMSLAKRDGSTIKQVVRQCGKKRHESAKLITGSC